MIIGQLVSLFLNSLEFLEDLCMHNPDIISTSLSQAVC